MSAAATKESVDVQRAEIEALVCGVPAGREGDRAFDEPWQIRAFALAVGAHKVGEFEWSAFQGALIESIQAWEKETNDLADPGWSYYEHWVNALESVLDQIGSIEPGALEAKTQEVLAVPPNRGHHKAHLDPIAVDPATPN
ncbi:nitrile hydratase accessory protein [Nocardioides sp. NPDC006303]|uniref:nitrile hydratase accessory protein n=1 Tax=Nocardioides sp. NPDC006303 TaxID=3156747 RepID=UPI0033BB730C